MGIRTIVEYRGWEIRVLVYADGDGFTPILVIAGQERPESQLSVPCETAIFASQAAAIDAAVAYAKRTIDGETPGVDLWDG